MQQVKYQHMQIQFIYEWAICEILNTHGLLKFQQNNPNL